MLHRNRPVHGSDAANRTLPGNLRISFRFAIEDMGVTSHMSGGEAGSLSVALRLPGACRPPPPHPILILADRCARLLAARRSWTAHPALSRPPLRTSCPASGGSPMTGMGRPALPPRPRAGPAACARRILELHLGLSLLCRPRRVRAADPLRYPFGFPSLLPASPRLLPIRLRGSPVITGGGRHTIAPSFPPPVVPAGLGSSQADRRGP